MIRVILVFLVIFLVLRLILSFFQVNSNTNTRTYSNTSSQRKEGDIYIDTSNNTKSKKISKNDGEYVDYEEL